MPFAEAYPELAEQGALALYDSVFESGRSYSDREAPFGDAHYNLTIQPIPNPDGSTWGLLVHGTDVTDLVRSRQHAERVQTRLEQLVNDVDAIVWEVDPKTFQFTFVSDRAEAITGYPVERWYEKDFWASIIHEDDRGWAFDYCLQCLNERTRDYDFEYRCTSADGRLIWFHDLVHLSLDENGQPEELKGLMVDITARKLAELERTRTHEKLQQVQKLESLGVLAGGIAHDFNNLLTGILGNASLAQAALRPGHPARSRIDAMIATAQRAAGLTNQMLAYSGKGAFRVETPHVAEQLREIVGLVEAAMPKQVRLKLVLDDALPAIEADASQLQQVFMNLVLNGAEATGESGGVVHVSTSLIDADEGYTRAMIADEMLAPGQYIAIEVADDGCGMDAETRARIFDPFYTTKATGRGLGLAAVLGIIRGHGGGMSVYSELGKGTTFKVLLPVSSEIPAPVAKAASESGVIGEGIALVVDDEPQIRQVARYMLEMVGYDVIEAPGGREALALFREYRDEVAVILLDLTMPEMDGEEVFRQLRRVAPGVRVILSSGYNQVEATRRFMGKGLAGFLQKPYTYEQLCAALADVSPVGE